MRRLVLVSVFLLLTIATAAPATDAARDVVDTGALAAWLRLTFILLKVMVAIVFTVAVITRGEAKKRAREPIAFAACTLAIASSIPLQPPDAWSNTSLMLVGELIALVSAAWVVTAAITLGKSFSVLPDARELVTRGLYAHIRHPLYVGEFGMVAGLVIAAPKTINLLAIVLFMAGQAIRVRLEEATLTREFPEYVDYAARTPRYVPRPRLGARSADAVSAEAA